MGKLTVAKIKELIGEGKITGIDAPKEGTKIYQTGTNKNYETYDEIRDLLPLNYEGFPTVFCTNEDSEEMQRVGMTAIKTPSKIIMVQSKSAASGDPEIVVNTKDQRIIDVYV